jgi:hypothetical protein
MHAEYAAKLPEWERARDVLGGEDRIKAAGEAYLPRLDSQNDAAYATYKARASFFNATARTAEGYLGQIFRAGPVVMLPEGGAAGAALGAFQRDVDLGGRSLRDYARDVVADVIGFGRCGTLVDWDEREERAYLNQYGPESILNWRETRLGGRLVLDLVVLQEAVLVADAEDPFEGEAATQLRVLRLRPGAEDAPAACSVEVWRERSEDGSKKAWGLVESRVPVRRGVPLGSIPFVFHGPVNGRPACAKLPLADVIALNLDHYRLDADYKHGCHYTALPTAWVSGFEKESVLPIGSSHAWVTEQAGAAAGFLEFTGKGLSTFENAMARDESLMAVLGARALEQQKMVGESAQAIALRHAAQDSVLAGLASAVSVGLTAALGWVAWWHGLGEAPGVGAAEAMFQLNTDFATAGMSAREIREVVVAWQAGAISHDALLDALRRGEVLGADRSNAEEKRAAKVQQLKEQHAAEVSGGNED